MSNFTKKYTSIMKPYKKKQMVSEREEKIMKNIMEFVMENPDVAFVITLVITMIISVVIIGVYCIIDTIVAIGEIIRDLVLYEMFNLNSRHNKNKGV